MNQINVSDIKAGDFITEDSYIFNDLFYVPKKTLIKDYHVEILKMWSADTIFTNGVLVNKDGEYSDDAGDDLLSVMESGDNILEGVTGGEENETPAAAGETAQGDSKVKVVSKNDSYQDIYKRWILMIISFFNSILTTKDVNKQNVINFINDIESFVKKDKDSILLLMGQDIEGVLRVYRQSLETVILSFIMSHSLNISDFAKTNLVLGALFHDIGMLKIPKTILEKKGDLSPDEIKLIQSHTIIGFNYIREAKYSAIIASGALQHHERIDGKGYPEHKTADQITNIGKIISVIDSYCASISSKSFRSPVHAKEAVQDILKKSGSAYDPEILKEFVKNISIYPIGSFVLLSNNYPAKVVGSSGIAMRPVVLSIVDGKEGEKIDLSKRIDIYIKGVYSRK